MHNQTTPYRDHPPHQAGSPTSAAAAAGAAPKAATLRQRALDVLGSCQFGATDHELASALGIPLQSAVPRRRELVLRDLVRDSGSTRPTPSGRQATVWERVREWKQEEMF